MSCLGVHFASTPEEVTELRSRPDERSRLAHLQEVIEETYLNERPELTAESGKAWDAMHRALTDGQLTWDGGDYPLNHVILAGELLYTRPDYIMSLKTPEQVRDIVAGLPRLEQSEFRRRYFAINPQAYGMPVSEEDFADTWEHFKSVREFYGRAAAANRFVLFTADQ